MIRKENKLSLCILHFSAEYVFDFLQVIEVIAKPNENQSFGLQISWNVVGAVNGKKRFLSEVSYHTCWDFTLIKMT